jgi:hypothetical protein
MINNQKRATESFLVATTAATTIPVTGTLNDSTTLNVNLANGQFGLVAQGMSGTVAYNSFLPASPLLTSSNAFAIFQGNENSASMTSASAVYPLAVRPYERTNVIDGTKGPILVTKQAYRAATHNIWSLGSINTTGAINVLDDTEYRFYMTFAGRNVDELSNGTTQSSGLRVSFTTPADLSTNTVTYPKPIDWIATKLAYEINRNSSAFTLSSKWRGTNPVVAFAVGTSATNGTSIAGLTAAGQNLAVFTYNGTDRSIYLTPEMVASLQTAATASSFTYIYKVVVSDAGVATTNDTLGIFIMALDRTTSYVDRIPEIKIRIRPGLNAGFNYNTVSLVERTLADEGQGYSRQLDILYKNTAGQRKYAQRHVVDPIIEYPSPIVAGGSYVVYNINHGRSEQVSSTGGAVYSPYREIICIPRFSSGTTVHEAIGLLDAALNSYLSATTNPAIVVI